MREATTQDTEDTSDKNMIPYPNPNERIPRIPKRDITLKDRNKLEGMATEELVAELENDMFHLNTLENGFGVKGYSLGTRVKAGFRRFWMGKVYNLDRIIKGYSQQVESEREELSRRGADEKTNFKVKHILTSDNIRLVRQKYIKFEIKKEKERKIAEEKEEKNRQKAIRMAERRDFFRNYGEIIEMGVVSAGLMTICAVCGYKANNGYHDYSTAKIAYAQDQHGADSLRWDSIEELFDDTRSDLRKDQHHSPKPEEAEKKLAQAMALIQERDGENDLAAQVKAMIDRIPYQKAHWYSSISYNDDRDLLEGFIEAAEAKEFVYDSQVAQETRDAQSRTKGKFYTWLISSILVGLAGIYATGRTALEYLEISE